MAVLSNDDFVRLFQRTFGLKDDGWAGTDTEAKRRELAALTGGHHPDGSSQRHP